MTSRRQFMGASFASLIEPAQANPRIQASRDAAMAVLKPSPRDLQHGFELHAQSLVVESYGFSPRSGTGTGPGTGTAVPTGFSA